MLKSQFLLVLIVIFQPGSSYAQHSIDLSAFEINLYSNMVGWKYYKDRRFNEKVMELMGTFQQGMFDYQRVSKSSQHHSVGPQVFKCHV